MYLLDSPGLEQLIPTSEDLAKRTPEPSSGPREPEVIFPVAIHICPSGLPLLTRLKVSLYSNPVPIENYIMQV